MFLVVRAGAWQQGWDQAWEEQTSAGPLPKPLFGKIHEGLLKYLQVRSPINILKTSNKPQKSYSEKNNSTINFLSKHMKHLIGYNACGWFVIVAGDIWHHI